MSWSGSRPPATSVSLFKNGWGGTHNLKSGFEIYRDTQTRDQIGYPGNVLQAFNNGVATEVRLFQPSLSVNRMLAGGVYVTDGWTLGDRLYLNVGVRVDRYRSYLPAQSRPASEFAPAATFAAVANIATAAERYVWADRNADRTWQRGEEGRLISRTGGASLALDPNLDNAYTDELATWLDHELLPHFQ